MSGVMAHSLGRTSMRQISRRFHVTRRFESTTTQKATDAAKDAAGKASTVASDYQAKAAQGISRVTSAAGPAIVGAAMGVTSALGRIGGRTGRMIGFLEKQVPWVIYYSRVGVELSKLVFQGQKMAPPSMATIQSYYRSAWGLVRQPGKLFQTVSQTVTPAAQTAQQQPTALLHQFRNANRAQLVAGGVVLAECLGFFTVGEILGKFKLVGYHGKQDAHH